MSAPVPYNDVNPPADPDEPAVAPATSVMNKGMGNGFNLAPVFIQPTGYVGDAAGEVRGAYAAAAAYAKLRRDP